MSGSNFDNATVLRTEGSRLRQKLGSGFSIKNKKLEKVIFLLRIPVPDIVLVRLVQFRMRAGTIKNHFLIFLVNTVYEKPIRFDMTLPPILVVSMQRVVFMLWQKWGSYK